MKSISNWLQIGGKTWDVSVLKIKESGNILYSDQTGRTTAVGAKMTLDPLGTFIGHEITVECRNNNYKEYDSLVEYVRTPRYNGINVKAVDGQTALNYQAYVSGYEREVKRIDVKRKIVHWKELTINIVPMEAQILPL